MANYPSELRYTKSHEWVRQEGDLCVIGLTEFAAQALGDIVYIGLPEIGDEVTAGGSFGDVESVKAVSDVFSPVSGKVAQINEELIDAPEKVNESPYDAWLIKVEDISDTEDLLDADAYEAVCAEEEN